MSGVATETLSDFQRRVGYEFRDVALLERALTHKSFTNEHREARSPNNERMEFLGDAVLGFVVGELIYRFFPDLQEGALSKIKAHLVSSTTLAAKGRDIGLGRFLRMGAGEARSGGAEKLSLIADAFEAVIAGIYLDGGLPAAAEFVRRVFGPEVAGIDVGDLSFHDYKTALSLWACRFRSTASSTSSAPTTRRRSSWSSPGTALRFRAAAAPPSARRSARRRRRR